MGQKLIKTYIALVLLALGVTGCAHLSLFPTKPQRAQATVVTVDGVVAGNGTYKNVSAKVEPHAVKLTSQKASVFSPLFWAGNAAIISGVVVAIGILLGKLANTNWGVAAWAVLGGFALDFVSLNPIKTALAVLAAVLFHLYLHHRKQVNGFFANLFKKQVKNTTEIK